MNSEKQMLIIDVKDDMHCIIYQVSFDKRENIQIK